MASSHPDRAALICWVDRHGIERRTDGAHPFIIVAAVAPDTMIAGAQPLDRRRCDTCYFINPEEGACQSAPIAPRNSPEMQRDWTLTTPEVKNGPHYP
jgi:hypothetical protein